MCQNFSETELWFCLDKDKRDQHFKYNTTLINQIVRYDADQIYTYIGEILIGINPFKDLQIYSEGATLLYQDVQKESLPPHIFMVACTTHQAMIHKV